MKKITLHEDKKIVYFRKPKIKNNDAKTQDPISHHFKHQILSQMTSLTHHASLLQTNYGNFLPLNNHLMSRTGNSFRGKSGSSPSKKQK